MGNLPIYLVAAGAVLLLVMGASFAAWPERVMRMNLRLGAKGRDSVDPVAYRRAGYLLLLGAAICASAAFQIARLG